MSLRSTLFLIATILVLIGTISSADSSASIGSSGEPTDCVIYISSTSTNYSNTCGSVENPCGSIISAIEACNYQGNTQSMMFNFTSGTFVIPNDQPIKYLAIYNQNVIINGATNGTTTFTFSDPSEPAVIINETTSHNPTSNDTTKFTINNVFITDLTNTFINSYTNVSNVNININFCTFSNLSITQNLINLNGTGSGVSSMDVVGSLFDSIQCAGPALPTPINGFIISSDDYSVVVMDSNFTNNVCYGSIMYITQASGGIQESTFYNNNVNSVILFNEQGPSFLVNTNSFNHNTNNGQQSSIITSISSTVNIQRSNFEHNSEVSPLIVVDPYKSTIKFSNSFANNIVSNNAHSGSLVSGSQGSSIYAYNNTFSNNVIGEAFSSINSMSLVVSSNSFENNIGDFVYASVVLDVELLGNTLNGNSKSVFFNCDASTVQANSNNYNNEDSEANLLVVECTNCSINGDGCDFDSSSKSSSTDSSKKKDDNKDKIIAAVVIVVIGVAVISGLIYYFAVHKRRHHYTRIVNSHHHH